jgi:hypothetical protein
LKPFLAAADRCLHESELRAIEENEARYARSMAMWVRPILNPPSLLLQKRFRARLEGALQAGDLAEAARISDEKSTLEAQASLQRARERQAYATDLTQRQRDADAKKKKGPLHWR